MNGSDKVEMEIGEWVDKEMISFKNKRSLLIFFLFPLVMIAGIGKINSCLAEKARASSGVISKTLDW
jgi:hypothetical protein